jgi:hypothetical protein
MFSENNSPAQETGLATEDLPPLNQLSRRSYGPVVRRVVAPSPGPPLRGQRNLALGWERMPHILSDKGTRQTLLAPLP